MKQVRMDLYKHYPSLHAWIDEAEKTPAEKRQSSVNGDEDFTGTKDLNESLDIARNGYAVRELDAKLNAIKTNEKKEMELHWDVAGGSPDVVEFLSGNPECMMTMEETPSSHKYAHIVVALSEAWHINQVQYKNRMASIATIVNNLEVDGYRIRVDFINSCDYSAGRVAYTACIKDYSESLGLAEVAGILHPGFLRRLRFLYDEGQSWFNDYAGYGMNLNHEAMKDVVKQVYQDDAERIEFLPALTSIKMSDSKAWNKAREFKDAEGAKIYAEIIEKQIRQRNGEEVL